MNNTSSARPFTSNFSKVYFRGTPNDWSASEMTLVADHLWEITVDFGRGDFERFKFDIEGDWSHNYGDTDNNGIAERNGKDIYVSLGEHKITFNDETLQYHLQVWSEGTAVISFEQIDDPAAIEGLRVRCSNGGQYAISDSGIKIRNLPAGKHRVRLDAVVGETRYWFKKTFEIEKDEPIVTKEYKLHTVDIPFEYQRLFHHDNFHRIEIRLPRSEWNGMMKDMTMHRKKFGNLRTGNYRKATFVYDGPAYGGEQVVLENAGFRTKGNSSRAYPQKNEKYQRVHWKIKFGEFINDREFASLRSLILRHNKGDDSQMREFYSYDLLNRAGVRTAKTAPARLYFRITEDDGSESLIYYGVYTILEPVDKTFLTKFFGKKDNDGNLYKCRKREEFYRGAASLGKIYDHRMVGEKDWRNNYTPSYDLQTNTDAMDHSVLYDFINRLNSLKGDQLHEFLEEHVHVDMFIRFLAMQKLLGTTDDYLTNSNNFMIYFDDDDELTFIPLDYDNCLGRGWVPFDTARSGIYAMTFRDEPVLATKILSFRDYKRKYQRYLIQFLHPENKLFVYSDYNRRFDRLKHLYTHRADEKYHDYLANDTVSAHEMKKEPQVREYFHARTRSVLRQLGLSFDGYETA